MAIRKDIAGYSKLKPFFNRQATTRGGIGDRKKTLVWYTVNVPRIIHVASVRRAEGKLEFEEFPTVYGYIN